MKKLLTIILLFVILPGCVPAAFVAGATAGGAIIYDKRNLKTMLQDREIVNRANTLITDQKALHNCHIVVTAFDHIVLIVGQTPTPEQRQLVNRIVGTVPSIKRIYNRITIAAPTSTLARTNDAWITSKVKTMMLAKRGLRSTHIKVLTENGVAYLMGTVSRKQGELASDVARRVAGVQEVVKIFEYT